MRATKQYLQDVQKDYLKAGRAQRGLLLDEARNRTGYNRKYLIDRLSVKTQWNKERKFAKRNKEYTADLIAPLVKLWDIFDCPCSERLKSAIEDELERLRRFNEIFISDEQAGKLSAMSSKTIDSLLAHEKEARHLKEKTVLSKCPLLYQKIKTKLSDEWDREKLGQIQVDAVEHCGQTTAGEYANTISTTDIGSQWWEGEAVMGKSQRRTLAATKAARSRYPFAWTEIHPDNGTSFINYFVYDYAKESKLEFSRSRPYKKNDNCFVEQKNSQNVRKVVGHVRYDTAREVNILNDLYRNELRLYKNFFQPVMRLETKIRNKGRVYRKYQKAKTPYRWLMESKETPLGLKQKLNETYQSLNPAYLKRSIAVKLDLLAKAYQAKHAISDEKQQLENQISVRFSNYSTGRVGLGVQIT